MRLHKYCNVFFALFTFIFVVSFLCNICSHCFKKAAHEFNIFVSLALRLIHFCVARSRTIFKSIIKGRVMSHVFCSNIMCLFMFFVLVDCQSGEWRCSDGTCIPDYLKCDGQPQCPDYSDEVNCPTGMICFNCYE